MNKFSFAALVVSTAAQLSFGATLKCERDTRPVDGPYTALEIVENAERKYDVYYHVITAGFGSPVGESRVKIAQNLTDCTIGGDQGVLWSCTKYPREAGEKSNTGFSTKRVTESSIIGKSGKIVTTETIEVKVYSPILLDGTTPGLPHMERKGVVTETFSATGSQGAMLNRCSR